MDSANLWARFRGGLIRHPHLGVSLDVSRIECDARFLAERDAEIREAIRAMAYLESGAVANPDEGRMVGHYWLRAPQSAPTPEIQQEISLALAAVRRFSEQVHTGAVIPPAGDRFNHVIFVGIGGSALGPQFLADALAEAPPLTPVFLDNTDPAGIQRALRALGGDLAETLVVVTSKSGGTKETRNGMIELDAAYRAQGLALGDHAVAVTGAGSELDRWADRQRWLQRFPMWDWVGGRTSITSAVGLLPAALLGIPIEELLAGAAAMDEWTREAEPAANPAASLALMWHFAGEGAGRRDMVVLPYSDRLALFGRYLQQLVMESLGKELDLHGRQVHQGIVVYGNKGSTDQHAYVQQLRDGPDNFFATFLRVLDSGEGPAVEVEAGVTSGDYLNGFLLGTRAALTEKGRGSITITLDRVDAYRVGALIALFERAVGLYASLVGINAYHQPGVEAGKKAAARILSLQASLLGALRSTGRPLTAEAAAEAAGKPEAAEDAWHILTHLAAGHARGVVRAIGVDPAEDTFETR